MLSGVEFRDYNSALRCYTDWRKFITAYIEPLSSGWLYDRNDRYGHDAAIPSAVAFQHMVEDTVAADPCWMSHEMMDLVQHAMVDFDSDEPFGYEDSFIPHGFMVLPEPFYAIDVSGKRMAQRAYLWRTVEHGAVVIHDNDFDGVKYTYNLNAEGEVVPSLRITTLSHIDDEDNYTEEMEEVLAGMRSENKWWGVIHATDIPLPLVASMRDMRGEGDPQAGWMKFWRVAQKIMSERIITTERRPAMRAFRRDAQRLGYDVGAPRVIELRRPTERDTDPEGERLRDVNWSHRWINRGHWRQQPYPSLGITKQIWISAYVKGPENLPLVIRERVWNFDR